MKDPDRWGRFVTNDIQCASENEERGFSECMMPLPDAYYEGGRNVRWRSVQ
jgi:hypothetical protein